MKKAGFWVAIALAVVAAWRGMPEGAYMTEYRKCMIYSGFAPGQVRSPSDLSAIYEYCRELRK